MGTKHANLAARVLGTPLLIAPGKLDAILAVLGPRLGLDLPMPAPGPETEEKDEPEVSVDAGIAHVQVIGTLAHRVSMLDAMSGASDYAMLGAEIERLAADPSVKGILLEVDSFGGEAAGCFDLADRIHAAAQVKPVYGVASQFAMSAGYALLSQASKVFVPQSGEVGSIGVVATHIDRTAQAAKEGIRVTHIHKGARKVDLSPFVELSEEARAKLAADIDTLYEQFVGVVSRGRGSALDADGARATEAATFIGQAAVDAGLADAVGDSAAALAALRGEIEDRMKLADLESKVTTLTASLAEANKRIAAYEDAEKARLAAEDAAYLEGLAAQSAALQEPLSPEKIAKVKAHIDAGRRDLARELGAAYLEAAGVKGGKPAPGDVAKIRTATPTAPNEDHQRAAVRGEANALRRAGYTVVLSDDERSIISATPPGGAPGKG